MRKHDQELIATDARDCVLSSSPRLEAFRDFLEEQITNRMPQRVIDVLKSIKVQEQEGDLAFLAPGAGQCLGHSIAKERAIWESGQGIIVSKELDSFVGEFSISDVTEIPD